MVNDPITFLLGLALGVTLYQFAKTLYQGLVGLGRARRREALHRWRSEQQVGWRVTIPVGHIEKQPYLGMDIPQYANRTTTMADEISKQVNSYVSTIDSEVGETWYLRTPRPHVEADAILLDDRLKDEKRFPLGYSSDMSAGMDLYACIDEPITLEPDECKLIGTGVAICLNNNSTVGLLTPRSGLGHKHGIVLGNLTGVIDADYQGEIKASLWNRSNTTYTVQPMDRIAQFLVVPQFGLSLNFVDSFEESGRGQGGFGSSGR